jgi:hypothetical protein
MGCVFVCTQVKNFITHPNGRRWEAVVRAIFGHAALKSKAALVPLVSAAMSPSFSTLHRTTNAYKTPLEFGFGKRVALDAALGVPVDAAPGDPLAQFIAAGEDLAAAMQACDGTG